MPRGNSVFGVQSNCVAIVPVETSFGRKRQIDQSACNKDYSCLKGFCPSFVTIEGGELIKGLDAEEPAGDGAVFPVLPEPQLPALAAPWSIMVTGIGGTGVITIGHILGMAAHLEGKGSRHDRHGRPVAKERRGGHASQDRRPSRKTSRRCASPPAAPISSSAAIS